ncbi:MAG: class I SAM-dependent methyltransferase [Acidimicrobiales bacterium]
MGRFTRFGFEVASHTRLRKYLYYKYDYSFTPAQLCFLVGCLQRTASVRGPILEVGCAYGHTTAFLNKHLEAVDDPRQYVCVDTFGGFTASDTKAEATRGKSLDSFEGRYEDASLRFFERTMANSGVTRVRAVKADIVSWVPDISEKLSFCLIDVDLYQPVKAALKKLVPLMQPGGIIVVDDCKEHPLWDGALQAYQEFVEGEGRLPLIFEGQLGLIEIAR